MKTILIILAFFGITLLDNFNEPLIEKQHSCRWSQCPYQGVFPSNYNNALLFEHDGEDCTDSWCIDSLHLEYPDADYDQLEDKLFQWGGEPLPAHFTSPSGIEVVDSCHDKRGLISVTIMQDGKEMGYDYLTPQEYDSLINK